MVELDTAGALPLLARHLGCEPNELRLTALGGGVSNLVYLVEIKDTRVVVKQALGKLRVEQEWLCDPHRIHREAAAMRALALALSAGAVPRLLFEDFENGIIGMEAAPSDARPWKEMLLAGEFDERVASDVGALHAAWIRESARRPEWGEEFGGLQTFIDLRVDPYYRTTAARHPEFAGRFASLEQQCLERRVSLVHGDLSPKNLLVLDGRATLIDHEVIHWGDPSFDASFLTNHLILKIFRNPDGAGPLFRLAAAYWSSLLEGAGPRWAWMEASAMAHLGGLMLARVDGKSPVEYLSEVARDRVRSAAIGLLRSPASSLPEALERCFNSWV